MKLKTKITLILMSALAVELIFLGVMAGLIVQSERLAEQSKTSQLIVYNSMTSIRQLFDCGQALTVYAVLHQPDAKTAFETCLAELKSSRQKIEELTAGKPKDEELLKKFHNDSEDVATLLEDIDGEINRTSVFDPISAQRLKTWLGQYLRKSATRLRADLQELISRHQNVRSEGAERARSTLKVVIGLAFVFNGFVFYGLAKAFADGLSSRIFVLKDNTSRLVSGSDLNPLVKGNDEVADLDKFLHETAKILRAASERDKIIMNYVPSGIILCTHDLSVEFVNYTFELMTGFQMSEVRGKHLSELFVDSNAVSLAEGEALVRKVHDALLICQSRDSVPCEISIARYEDVKRELVICSVLDVSSKHEIERLKRDFLNVVSHDLSTPLTAIELSFDLLNQGSYGELPAAAKECVQKTDRELTRLLKMVSDLLTVSKIEAGLHLDMHKCSVKQLFESSLNSVMNLIDQKGIEIRLDVGDDLYVLADEGRMIQVIINLLSNAIKFTPDCGLIDLNATSSGSDVRLSVKDNGCGIPKAMKDNIFEKFVQVHESDRERGIGLGLAVCKLIVDAHGGVIGVNSEEGAGAEFWISLPATRF